MAKSVDRSRLGGRRSRRQTGTVPGERFGLMRDGGTQYSDLVPYNLVTPFLLDVDSHI